MSLIISKCGEHVNLELKMEICCGTPIPRGFFFFLIIVRSLLRPRPALVRGLVCRTSMALSVATQRSATLSRQSVSVARA